MRQDSLNYRHLYYFWVVAREGSLTNACRRLGVAPSTVSGQLKELEAYLGHDLFDRSGRSLSLTRRGEVAAEYAEQVFRLGDELVQVLETGRVGRPKRFRVGVSESLPQLLVQRLLESALDPLLNVQLHVLTGRPERLVSELDLHHLDLVLSNEPMDLFARDHSEVQALGSSGLSLFGAPDLVLELSGDLPLGLDGAPWLVPAAGSRARRQLDTWLLLHGVRPSIVAELAHSDLVQAFGGAGHGLFMAPTLIRREIMSAYGVETLGTLDGMSETYHALVPARQPAHPSIEAVIRGARRAISH